MVARGGSWRSPTTSVMPRPDSSVVERGPEKAGVGGSIPSLATTSKSTTYVAFSRKCKRIAREQCYSFAMHQLKTVSLRPKTQTVSVYTRHSADCPKRGEPQWRRCKCAKYLYLLRDG